MMNETKVGANPNEKMPAGKPLNPNELASDDQDLPGNDTGAGSDQHNPDGEIGSETPVQGDPENQAGSDSVDRDKFQRG